MTLPQLVLIVSIALTVSIGSGSGAVTSRVIKEQDTRSLNSPLPVGSRTRRNQATIMDVELSPIKRSADTGDSRNSTTRTTTPQKRFKTSGRAAASNGDQHHQQMVAASSGYESGRSRDSNNNSIPDDDNNNNNNNSNNVNNNLVDSNVALNWRRNVDSINGTVDLSQYGRSDIDRLYGDALLVYFKNFNETLPARREFISINGTISSSLSSAGTRNKIPIYRSVSTNEPK